MLVFCQQYFTR